MKNLDPTPAGRPRWRLRLSLRAMMALILVIGLPLGWKVRRASTQRRAVAVVRAMGWQISYEDEINPQGFPRLPHRPWGPAWLRRWVGDEFFEEVGYVNIDARLHLGRVDDDSLAAVGDFDRLQGLTIWWPRDQGDGQDRGQITAAGLARLTGLRRLRVLHLLGVPTDPAMVALLSRWTTLEDVELRDLGHPQGTLPGSCLAHLARLPGLRKVIITTLASCRAADVEPLTRLAHLEQLGLTRSAPSDAGVARFGSLPTLQVLSLPQTELTEPTLAELARIPGLGSLDFDGSRLPAGGLRALAGLTRLTYLNVAVDGLAGQPNAHHLIHRVRPRFGDDDLDALERVPLRDLMLMGMDATDAGVGRLLRSHSFVGLTLGGRGITDASIPLLVQQTGLRGLVLADTSITDAGLAQLKAIGGLRTLSLVDNARLTDTGVSGLAAFPALSYLTIRQPAVRSATLDAIRAARSKVGPSFNLFQPPEAGAR